MSIMNYLFQFADTLPNRPLTYSSARLPTLYEASLNEQVGVVGANWDWTAYSGVWNNYSVPTYVPLAVHTLERIDWDNDGDDSETSVRANINNYPKWDYYSDESESLEGFDDWDNLFFYFQQNANFANGEHGNSLGGDDVEHEITWDIVQAMREDAQNMLNGPTEPVKIIDPDAQPAPSEGTSPTPQASETQTNPFFIFFDQAISFAKSNPLIVGGVVAAVVCLIAISSLVKRRKKMPS
jgi:hypothetical protein